MRCGSVLWLLNLTSTGMWIEALVAMAHSTDDGADSSIEQSPSDAGADGGIKVRVLPFTTFTVGPYSPSALLVHVRCGPCSSGNFRHSHAPLLPSASSVTRISLVRLRSALVFGGFRCRSLRPFGLLWLARWVSLVLLGAGFSLARLL
jgi:hypothetical protein